MKIHVLYDKQGNVVAAGLPMPPSIDIQAPRSGPLPQEGQHAAELEVPEELTGLKAAELGERLHVDTKSKPHRLVAKSK